jgi:hypothetical protein
VRVYKSLKVVRVSSIGTKEVYSLTISLLYRLSRRKVRGISIASASKRNQVLKLTKVLIVPIISY